MAEQRHRTVLEIAVDDRGVKDLSTTLERAFEPEQIRAFTDAVDRSARAMGALESAIGGIRFPTQGGGAAVSPEERARRAEERDRQQAAKKEQRDKAAQDRAEKRQQAHQAKQEQQADRQQEADRAEARDVLRRAVDRVVGLAGSAAAGSFTSALAGALPIIGPGASGVLQGVQGFYQEYAASQQAIGRGAAVSNVDSLNPETFARFGYGPQEAAMLAAQLAQRTGRTGSDVSGLLGTQARLQGLAGIQGAGAVVGAAEQRGGRTADAAKLMMDAVSTGLEAGIRTVEIDKYLANVSAWVDRVRTEGIDMSVESALSITRGFSGLGMSFRGMAGAQRAQGFGDALSKAADKEGLGTGLAFEAARRVLGAQATLEDMIDLMERKDSEFTKSFIELSRGVFGSGLLGLRSVYKSMGVDMSIAQLRDLATGSTTGFSGQAGDSAEDLVRQRRGTVGRVLGGAPAFGAGMGFERAGVGATTADAAQSIMRNDLELAGKVLPHVAPIIKELSNFAANILTGRGAAATQGVLNKAGDALGIQNLGDDWRAGVKDGVVAALQEFFTADTLKAIVGGSFTGFLHSVGATDNLEDVLRNARPRKPGEPSMPGGAAPKEAPEPSPGTLAKPPGDGPLTMTIPRGAVPALREASRQLDHAASELERQQFAPDGALGYG